MSAATQDWRTLPAGRELDALVAERVFRADVHEGEYDTYWTLPGERYISDQRTMPAFSTDIAAAWQIVEALKDRYWFRLWTGRGAEAWVGCTVGAFSGDKALAYEMSELMTDYADAAPLAIVRATLAATEATP